jgi:hypothetical protein
MLKVRKDGPDAATVQQAIATAQWFIERSGGLSHEYGQDYWRFSTKAELRGWVEAGERFVKGINDDLAKEYGEASVSFLPGSMTWNKKLAATLVDDAKQGDADADRVLREVSAEFLTKRIPLPDELADYVVPYLQQANSNSRNQSHKTEYSSKAHKTEYRDWILALTVKVVVRRFNLNPTRNRETRTPRKQCACSIVAQATKLFEKTVPNSWLSEKTVANAWHRYKGIADQRTATNYVAQAMVSVPARKGIKYPRVLTSDGGQVAQENFLVRFPRVGSTEAKPRPKPRGRKA